MMLFGFQSINNNFLLTSKPLIILRAKLFVVWFPLKLKLQKTVGSCTVFCSLSFNCISRKGLLAFSPQNTSFVFSLQLSDQVFPYFTADFQVFKRHTLYLACLLTESNKNITFSLQQL